MTDPFDNWRAALSGKKLPIYESEPWVGYFAVQDRSPGVTPAKGNRWPLIPCAIFYQGDTLMAERAGKPVPVEWVWPYAAKHPIPYATYRHWHDTGRWPDQEKAA